MLNTSCESEEEELGSGGVLNDSGSDSGISNPCTSTWKRVGGGGGDATPSPDSPTLIEELVMSVVEDVVANAQVVSSAAADSNSTSASATWGAATWAASAGSSAWRAPLAARRRATKLLIFF